MQTRLDQDGVKATTQPSHIPCLAPLVINDFVALQFGSEECVKWKSVYLADAIESAKASQVCEELVKVIAD